MPRDVTGLFDEIASTYDLLNHLLSFNVDRWWRHITLHAANIPQDAVVLDLCTGTADLALAAAKHQWNSSVYGLDTSVNMLARARTKIFENSLTARIRLIHADAHHLPFLDERFDRVLLGFGLRNLANKEKGIQEIRRVLKERGQIVILEFAPPRKSLFGDVYCLYLGKLIPFIGKLISKSPSAYHYLYTSIEQFLQPDAVVTLLQKQGLREITARALMFGIAYVYVARK